MGGHSEFLAAEEKNNAVFDKNFRLAEEEVLDSQGYSRHGVPWNEEPVGMFLIRALFKLRTGAFCSE